MKKIILSIGRADLIAKYSFKLLPDAYVCVPEFEAEQYAKVFHPDKIMAHPRSVNDVVKAAQWARDNAKDDIVWLFDDDIKYLISFTGRSLAKYHEPVVIDHLIEQMTQMALDCGAQLAGFPISFDLKAYNSFRPYKFHGMINGSAIGHIKSKIPIDMRSGTHADADIALQHMLVNRFVLIDTRFTFESLPRSKVAGGCSTWRNAESYTDAETYLKRKWGRYINFSFRAGQDGAGTHITSVVVKRQMGNT